MMELHASKTIGRGSRLCLSLESKEENFLKDISWISDLKLQAEAGALTKGQRAGRKINNYNWIPTYSMAQVLTVFFLSTDR